jgi:hypothetical protein
MIKNRTTLSDFDSILSFNPFWNSLSVGKKIEIANMYLSNKSYETIIGLENQVVYTDFIIDTVRTEMFNELNLPLKLLQYLLFTFTLENKVIDNALYAIVREIEYSTESLIPEVQILRQEEFLSKTKGTIQNQYDLETEIIDKNKLDFTYNTLINLSKPIENYSEIQQNVNINHSLPLTTVMAHTLKSRVSLDTVTSETENSFIAFNTEIDNPTVNTFSDIAFTTDNPIVAQSDNQYTESGYFGTVVSFDNPAIYSEVEDNILMANVIGLTNNTFETMETIDLANSLTVDSEQFVVEEVVFDSSIGLVNNKADKFTEENKFNIEITENIA